MDKEMLELAAGMVAYNPETGSIKHLPKDFGLRDANRWNSRYANKEAGTLDDKGYIRLLFRFGKTVFRVRAHRLAWFIVYGVIPSGEIDHIDQNKTNNKMDNLRDVSRALNHRNLSKCKRNTSGVTGVSWHKQVKKWCATAAVDGKKHHIGSFDDIDDAEIAVKEFRSLNGFTEHHGREVSC